MIAGIVASPVDEEESERTDRQTDRGTCHKASRKRRNIGPFSFSGAEVT